MLVDHLVDLGVLKTPRLISAFRAVDRKDFVPEQHASEAYADHPLPIGGRQTISQPYTVAFMLELLAPTEGNRVLDVGSGSGYTTALLSAAVGEHGSVCGVEIKKELVEMGTENIKKYRFPHTAIVSGGGTIGFPEKAPYDRILVSAAAETVPQELIHQLAGGGTMVIPVGSGIERVAKEESGAVQTRRWDGFAFVPLRL